MQINKLHLWPLDGLWVATDQEIDPVLNLNDLLSDERLLALILLDFGFKTANGEFRSPSGSLLSLCNLQA